MSSMQDLRREADAKEVHFMTILRVKLAKLSPSFGSQFGYAAKAEFNHAVTSICHPEESREGQLQTGQVRPRLHHTAASNLASYREEGCLN